MVSRAPEDAVKPETPAVSSQGTAKPILKNAQASVDLPSISSKTRVIAEVRPEAKTEEPTTSDTKTATKLPTIRREQSDIFKSFSKPKPKLNREDTRSSTGASPAASAAPASTKVGSNPPHSP